MKRLIVIIFTVFGAFLTFSLYRTFAYDTSVVEETPSTTDLEYTFKIGNSSIKQITVDTGETKYYDVVLGNPNPAQISYGVYYEMVSPSTKPDDFSIEYTSKSTGESTGKVDKEGNITLNLVVTNTSSSTVTIKLGTVAGYVNGGDLELSSNQEFISKKKPTISEYVMNLDDGTIGDSGSGVYKVHHSAIPAESSATGEIIPATDDYRYYGASPNNYVCLDKNSDGTCEDKHLYRIIGSIYEENAGTNLLKVIKATPLTDGTTNLFDWDCKGYDSNVKLIAEIPEGEGNRCSSSSNTWSSSNEDSSLLQILNSTWLNSNTGNYYTNGTAVTLNFNNFGLSNNAKNHINEKSRYYLGGYSSSKQKVDAIYLVERTNTSNYSTYYWDGTVGLLYLSDYGLMSGNGCASEYNLTEYSSNCMSKNWMYKSTLRFWTISYVSSSNYNIWGIDNGRIMKIPSYIEETVYPTFYLKSDVSITGGTGSELDPYTVE